MRRYVFLFAALALTAALASCGQGDPQVDEPVDKDRIEATQKAPPVPVEPLAIEFADIEEGEFFGASCGFSPAETRAGGDAPVLFIAMGEVGVLKLSDGVQTLAPDTGSDELPYGARRKYDGREHSVTLDLEMAAGQPSGPETTAYPASLTIRDAGNEVVFSAEGSAVCGA